MTTRTHTYADSKVGERLRKARAKKGKSMRSLEFPGCSAAYISRIEDGSRTPSRQVLETLAEQLGVSAEQLATGRRAPWEFAVDAARDLVDAWDAGDLESEYDNVASAVEALRKRLEALPEP